MDSALDTHEYEDYSPPERSASPARRMTPASPRRPSRPSPPHSPSQQQVSSTSHAIPRARATSILTRGVEAAQSFASPLAQIFQPFVVEDPNEETTDQAPAGVSYGPATRRRLMSQNIQRRMSVDSHASPYLMKRFPTMPTDKVASSNKGGNGQVSESPDTLSDPKEPETVKQVRVDEESDAIELNQWISRLDKMEQRQERIETLLSQIAKDVRRNKD